MCVGVYTRELEVGVDALLASTEQPSFGEWAGQKAQVLATTGAQDLG